MFHWILKQWRKNPIPEKFVLVGLSGWSSHVHTGFSLELTLSPSKSVMKRKCIFTPHLSSSITLFLHSRLKTQKSRRVLWKSTTGEFDACGVHKHMMLKHWREDDTVFVTLLFICTHNDGLRAKCYSDIRALDADTWNSTVCCICEAVIHKCCATLPKG